MKSANPPRLAVWLLEHFGPEANREALAGDLCENYRQGRAKTWYWRQVLAALQWRRLLFSFLLSALLGWWLTLPFFGEHPPFLLNRPIDMALITVFYFASTFVPAMMRRRLRVLLVLLIAAIVALLWRYYPDVANHYWIVFWMVASNFVFYSKPSTPPPYHLSMRELLIGDPFAEKKRMIAKLERSMEEATDPELQNAYATAIAALQRGESPMIKAAE
jgi:hypothetical protein